MTRRRKALPPPPAGADPQTRQWMESVQEQLEVSQGVRGSSLDQFVAFGDILDIGLAQFRSGAKARFGANDLVPSEQVPNRAIPPAPEGVQGVAVIGVNTIIWSDPYARYSNHSHAEVWRAEGAGALLGAAVKIGTAEGTIYSDYTAVEGIVYVYWVRFISNGSINGPYHASLGVELTTMTRAETIIGDLSGQIDESFLTTQLNERINLIDTTGTGILDRLGITENDLYNSTTGIFALHASLEDIVTDPVTGLPTKVSQADFDSLSTIVTHPTTGLSARTLNVDFTNYQSDVTNALNAKASASAFSTLEAAVNDATTGLAAKAAITSLESVSSTLGVDPVTGTVVVGGRAESIDQISLELDDGSGGSRLAAIESVQTVQGDALDGLTASYVLKLDVDGYVSGFGLYNDGGTSDFTIAADRFSIAPPGSIGQVKPFIIDGGVVYMNMAVIKDAAIDQAKIGSINTGKLQLPNGTPITTVAGLIQANGIDVDNLTVQWANIQNVIIDYAEISGIKPAANADNTQAAVDSTIVMTQGAIRAGKTSANSTAPGYYLGFDGSTPELNVGNSSKYMHWDGTELNVKGSFNVDFLTVGEDGESRIEMTPPSPSDDFARIKFFAGEPLYVPSISALNGNIKIEGRTFIEYDLVNALDVQAGNATGTGINGRGFWGVRGYGTGFDFYASGSGANYGPFTGSHDGLVPKSDPSVQVGEIIKLGQGYWSTSLSQTICEVGLCDSKESPTACGIVTYRGEINENVDESSMVAGLTAEQSDEFRNTMHYVSFNAVGEGMLKVCGRGGDISSGDLLITSSMAGKAERQTDGVVRNTTIAKSRSTVTFSFADEVKLVPVNYLFG